MARRWTVATVVCLATALLAGCSGSTPRASTSLPTTSAPPAATASPPLPPLGPADFPVPAEAREKTPAGVAAFTRYYVALINQSSASLDTSAIRALSKQCDTCAEIADGYDAMKSAGQRFIGGAIVVAGMGSCLVTGNVGETSFELEEGATAVKDANGASVPGRDRPAARYTGGVRLSWDDSRTTWLMSRFDADPI
jgi:hypothetical protein